MQFLTFWLAAVLPGKVQGYYDHGGWEVLEKGHGAWEQSAQKRGPGWQVQGGEHGGWDVQQGAGRQMEGWAVQQQQPQYQDLHKQHQNHFLKPSSQQELYGQEKEEQYYAQFRGQIDQIQSRGEGGFTGSYSEPPSFQGVGRDDQQTLFGSGREFGELADPGFHFDKDFGESDPVFHFGRDSVNLGQPVAWEEARKR